MTDQTQQQQQSEKPPPPVRRKEIPVETPAQPVGTDLKDGVPRKKYRTYSFKIPKSARVIAEDPKVVVLRELGPDETDEARRLGGGSADRSAEEAVKLALWSVDGAKVDHTEEAGTYYWHRWSAKVRHLIHLAWGKIHVTDDDEDDAFLSSMEVGTDA